MSELRDARLQRALSSAPDADLRPAASTREAVRRAAMAAVEGVGGLGVEAAAGQVGAAQGAVRPAAPIGWRRLWSALWPDGGSGAAGAARRMPWNAALATVLLASLVTLLWRGQEIPGTEPGLEPADRPVAATAPGGASVDKPAGAPAASPQVAVTEAAPNAATAKVIALPVPAAPTAAVPKRSTPPAPASAREAVVAGPALAPAPAPTAPATISQPAQPAETVASGDRPRAARAAAPSQDVATPAREDRAALAKSAPQQSTVLADAAGPPAPAPAPATAPAPSPAAAATAKFAAPAGAAAQAPQRAEMAAPASALEAWTQIRILQASGPAVQIDRAQAPALAGLLRAALVGGPAGGPAGGLSGGSPKGAPAGPGSSFGPPTLRLELLQGGQRLGVLEVAGPLLRWTPAAADGSAGPARLVQPTPAALQALQDELARRAVR